MRDINADVTRAAKDVAAVVVDATYVLIGAAVLGFQRAQVQRNELGKRMQAPPSGIEDRVAFVRNEVSQALQGLDTKVEELADTVEELIERIETTVAPYEDRLPTQARDLVRQAHDQARDARSQIRSRIPKSAA